MCSTETYVERLVLRDEGVCTFSLKEENAHPTLLVPVCIKNDLGKQWEQLVGSLEEIVDV